MECEKNDGSINIFGNDDYRRGDSCDDNKVRDRSIYPTTYGDAVDLLYSDNIHGLLSSGIRRFLRCKRSLYAILLISRGTERII